MKRKMRLAAIDIGSNAVRCLISEAVDNEVPTKLKLLRIPIRLGFDTFNHGKILDYRLDKLQKTIKMFELLMDIYEVKDYRACATSAMRDASNSQSILQAIKKGTGVHIDLITGEEEASIIFETHIAELLDPRQTYLYIDVGGGSTELTLFSQQHKLADQSFNIGTIRLLNGQVKDKQWDHLHLWIKDHTAGHKNIYGIGSGGNINSIFQISRKQFGKPLSYDYISSFYSAISRLSLEERMGEYNMKPDRADVIGHACRIFKRVMGWGDIKELYVPQIGLVDGIVQILAEKNGITRPFA